MPPKVFISYSWASADYQNSVLDLADRLIKEGGVDVTIDEHDLKEGHDVMAFMERLATDKTINFVLALCDSTYTAKADSRKRGVGTEAQILSADVYKSVTQERCIPVLMERTETGYPCLPVFLRARKYIDFSSPELQNENFERLVRIIHGKPLRVKPEIGPTPAFDKIEVVTHFLKSKSASRALLSALKQDNRGVPIYRDELREAFIQDLRDTLLSIPEDEDDVKRWEQWLKISSEGRNLIVDWLLMEGRVHPDSIAKECAIPILESIYHLTCDHEFFARIGGVLRDALNLFADETALYVTASLMETDATVAIRKLFSHTFINPSYSDRTYTGLECFRHHSQMAEKWQSRTNHDWLSPNAELYTRRATHVRIKFHRIMEADALYFVFSLLNDRTWYPCTAAYAERGETFNWFAKAKHGDDPNPLAIITGKKSWTEVRDAFLQRFKDLTSRTYWAVFRFGTEGYLRAMCFDERQA